MEIWLIERLTIDSMQALDRWTTDKIEDLERFTNENNEILTDKRQALERPNKVNEKNIHTDRRI